MTILLSTARTPFRVIHFGSRLSGHWHYPSDVLVALQGYRTHPPRGCVRVAAWPDVVEFDVMTRRKFTAIHVAAGYVVPITVRRSSAASIGPW